MKAKVFKNRSIFLLALSMLLAGGTAAAQSAEKKIEKSYSISEGFTLGIDNKYGDINIANWDKDEVEVNITITVEANNKSRAESILEKINIDIAESNKEVSFETEINNINASKIDVVYDVKAPAYINAQLEQHYGNIFIQDLHGEVNIVARYSDLTAGSLARSDDDWNEMDLAYSDASIDDAGRMGIEVKYSGSLSISASKQLQIESAYSKFELGRVIHLDLESKYDKVNMDELLGSADIESAYTKVDLGNISNDFEFIRAEMSYGNLNGTFSANPSFDVNADAAYGSINLPDGSYNTEKSNQHVTVTGSAGSGGAKIEASLRYGSLNLD